MSRQSSPFYESIRSSQAEVALDNMSTTLLVSLVILTTTAAALWINMKEMWIPLWFAVSVIFTLYRLVCARRLVATRNFASDAEKTLGLLNRHSFISGCLWAILPLLTGDQLETSSGSLVLFTLAGMVAGAIIQNSSYAPPALLFYLPALVGATIGLILNATPSSYLIAINVALFSIVTARQSLRSDKRYWQGEAWRHETAALAQSLGDANRKIGAINNHLNSLAHTDALTALGNRVSFSHALATRLESALESRDQLALLLIDLDNFKDINDSQGHDIGDRVLQEVASRIRAICRPDGIVARLGGDEFAVLLAGPDVRGGALAISGRLISALSLPVAFGERKIAIGASIGLACFPEDAASAAELMISSDIALYTAKRSGKHRLAEFDAAMKKQLDVRRRLECDFAEAAASGQLAVYFQPQTDLRSGATIGHEALIRWSHPVLGNIPPPEIVAVAQSVHQADRLTRYVIGAATVFVNRLERLGDQTSIVSINVSPREFQLYSPATVILEVLAETGIDPHRIEVEITEEAILEAADADADLARLTGAGIRLAIDDFGAGHFSLSDAVALNLDRIKIDRSFITGIDGDERHRLLVDTIVTLTRKLNIAVLAEGVETRAEAETLLALGCLEAQGFLFSTPLSLEAALSRMDAERTAQGDDSRSVRA